MAIEVTCSCGKTLAANDKLAGRRVKCPDCSEPISIPGDSTNKAGPASLAASCQCGKSFAAKPALAGRTVKCPSCGQPVKIPNPQTSSAVSGENADRGDAATTSDGAVANDGEEADYCMAGLLDELGMEATRTGVRCPNCRSDLEADAIICIDCGFNIETGKQLKTDSFVNKSKLDGISAPTEKAKNGKSKLGFLGGLFGKK